MTLICFNCGNSFTSSQIPDADKISILDEELIFKAMQEGFCSLECMNADDAKLREGNELINKAIAENPAAFSDLNKLKLDAAGITNVAVAQAASSMIKFGAQKQSDTLALKGEEDNEKE